MVNIPIEHVQIVQEYTVNESQISQSSDEALYQMSEIDLSFCDVLANLCSGEASSGPVSRHIKSGVSKT